MNVEFWFDPACPFCWVTSRWINRVTPERDLRITWRPISLLFKNDLTDDSPFYATARRTTDLLRVVEAARDAGRADRIGDLYTEMGRHIHSRKNPDFDVAATLETVGLDPSLAAAADDPSWDQAIRASMADGLALTGDDVGTPLIAVDTGGRRAGFFGPVITELPDLETSLELWDGMVKMLGADMFFELKRTRSVAPTPPDESVLDEQLAARDD